MTDELKFFIWLLEKYAYEDIEHLAKTGKHLR
jgi:hypothetical protein